MSKLLLIFGILFLAFGVAVGLKIYFNPGQMQILGLTAEVAAMLLVGGVLSLGLGGVIGALDDGMAVTTFSDRPKLQAGMMPPGTPKFEGTARPAAEKESAPPAPSISETVVALEQAQVDIARALGVAPTKANEAKLAATVEIAPEPEEEPESEAVVEIEEETEEIDLYVVEEKVIRGRPARVLSDGTVEAETDEGWMRFENLEHLNEYIDAMAPEA